MQDHQPPQAVRVAPRGHLRLQHVAGPCSIDSFRKIRKALTARTVIPLDQLYSRTAAVGLTLSERDETFGLVHTGIKSKRRLGYRAQTPSVGLASPCFYLLIPALLNFAFFSITPMVQLSSTRHPVFTVLYRLVLLLGQHPVYNRMIIKASRRPSLFARKFRNTISMAQQAQSATCS
jgi:hypothetical protein